MSFEKQTGNQGGKTGFNFDLVSKIFQSVVLGAIALTLLLSPFLVYYFTTNFESKLPICTASQPASDVWRCKVDQDGAVRIAGGNPAYCEDGKQHFLNRGWCNFNWDRPLTAAD